MKKLVALLLVASLASCTSNQTTQIAEGVFVHNSKVYKIIDNELSLVGDLKNDSIRKFQVTEPVKREFGDDEINFVKHGASVSLDALYRGSTLYYNFYLTGLNDLKENYESGHFIVKFLDEHNFILHSTIIETGELTGMVGSDMETVMGYSTNGKTEMSTDIYNAIDSYTVSSTVKPKSSSSKWGW